MLIGPILIMIGAAGLTLAYAATVLGGGPVAMAAYGGPSLILLALGMWLTL